MNTHILKNFDKELKNLVAVMLKMASNVDKQLSTAIESFDKTNEEVATKTIHTDKKINQLEVEINELCFAVIATYQPVASDLRIPISILKMSNDLERIGDEAEKLAVATLASADTDYAARIPLLKIANRIHSVFQNMLKALGEQDIVHARQILEADLSLHQRYDKALDEVLDVIQNYPDHREQNIAYLWAIKGLERISDHIRNICEQMIYMETGSFYKA